MNKAILMGRLTKDPELRYSQSNEPISVCNFTIAINRRSKKTEVDFINCVAFGQAAETINKYFSKGSMIAIEGRIQNDTYTDKETGKNRVSTKIVVESFHFTGEKAENQNSNYYSQKKNNNSYESTDNPPWEDIPVSDDSTLPF